MPKSWNSLQRGRTRERFSFARTSRARAGTNNEPRAGSKMAEVIAMMQRAKGATIAEIMSAMGWQRALCRRPDYADLCWQTGLWRRGSL